MTLLKPLCPTTGRPLRADTPHSLTAGDGGPRWPVAAGIPYLRPGRDDLRDRALSALDSGDEIGGLAVLLTDQDPFAPLPPPTVDECRRLVTGVGDGSVSLRQAMAALSYGPVADYFAVRTSTPTFLSGLGLLSQCGGQLPVVEVACGIGQLLREPHRRQRRMAGVDLVFSKLWLARRFVVPDAELVCGDICAGPVAEPPAAVTVLCHDAFYFFPDKPRAAAHMIRLAGAGGRVLVGHAHSAGWDHGGVAGSLLTPSGYAELFPGCQAFDDAAFTAAFLTGKPAPPAHPEALGGVEAVSLAWGGGFVGAPDRYADVPAGTELVLNPLLMSSDGRLSPRWPSPRLAAEYRTADYLSGEQTPGSETLHAAASGLSDPDDRLDLTTPCVWDEVGRLARRRILIPREDVI